MITKPFASWLTRPSHQNKCQLCTFLQNTDSKSGDFQLKAQRPLRESNSEGVWLYFLFILCPVKKTGVKRFFFDEMCDQTSDTNILIDLWGGDISWIGTNSLRGTNWCWFKFNITVQSADKLLMSSSGSQSQHYDDSAETQCIYTHIILILI